METITVRQNADLWIPAPVWTSPVLLKHIRATEKHTNRPKAILRGREVGIANLTFPTHLILFSTRTKMRLEENNPSL